MYGPAIPNQPKCLTGTNIKSRYNAVRTLDDLTAEAFGVYDFVSNFTRMWRLDIFILVVGVSK